MDRGAWQATVHGVAKSQTRLKRLSTQHAQTRGRWRPAGVQVDCSYFLVSRGLAYACYTELNLGVVSFLGFYSSQSSDTASLI